MSTAAVAHAANGTPSAKDEVVLDETSTRPDCGSANHLGEGSLERFDAQQEHDDHKEVLQLRSGLMDRLAKMSMQNPLGEYRKIISEEMTRLSFREGLRKHL